MSHSHPFLQAVQRTLCPTLILTYISKTVFNLCSINTKDLNPPYVISLKFVSTNGTLQFSTRQNLMQHSGNSETVILSNEDKIKRSTWSKIKYYSPPWVQYLILGSRRPPLSGSRKKILMPGHKSLKESKYLEEKIANKESKRTMAEMKVIWNRQNRAL